MAHDFYIMNIRTRKMASFFGYADGVMYKAFDAQEHDRGCSGDGWQGRVDKGKTKAALAFATTYFDNMNYLDPKRMDDIKKFAKDMEQDEDNDIYAICFD